MRIKRVTLRIPKRLQCGLAKATSLIRIKEPYLLKRFENGSNRLECDAPIRIKVLKRIQFALKRQCDHGTIQNTPGKYTGTQNPIDSESTHFPCSQRTYTIALTKLMRMRKA